MNKKQRVKRIFDSISPKYDFLNHFLSAGVDYYWRRKAIKLSGLNKDSVLLDVACGTGDLAIEARKQGVQNIFGADLSHNMLSFFNKKSDWINGRLIQGVAEQLPYRAESFTNITVAFGVRNFYSIPEGLKSFHNVLKENGRVTILEFRMPENKIIKSLYSFYFKNILPALGKLFSKDNEAYQYLPDSVGEFDEKVDLVALMNNAGFSSVKKHNLTFGLVQVVVGTK